jgi:hypothetical protein
MAVDGLINADAAVHDQGTRRDNLVSVRNSDSRLRLQWWTESLTHVLLGLFAICLTASWGHHVLDSLRFSVDSPRWCVSSPPPPPQCTTGRRAAGACAACSANWRPAGGQRRRSTAIKMHGRRGRPVWPGEIRETKGRAQLRALHVLGWLVANYQARLRVTTYWTGLWLGFSLFHEEKSPH